MSFTRDWLESDPVDHSKFKNQPSYVRNTKVDISDRIKNLIYGFTVGETSEGFKKVPLYNSTAPGTNLESIIL